MFTQINYKNFFSTPARCKFRAIFTVPRPRADTPCNGFPSHTGSSSVRNLAALRPASSQLFGPQPRSTSARILAPLRSATSQHFGPHPHRHAARKPRHLYYTQKPAKCFVGGRKNLPAAGNPPRACRPGLHGAAAPPAFGHLIPLARLAIAEAKTKSFSSRFSAWRMLSLVPSHHLQPSWM